MKIVPSLVGLLIHKVPKINPGPIQANYFYFKHQCNILGRIGYGRTLNSHHTEKRFLISIVLIDCNFENMARV